MAILMLSTGPWVISFGHVEAAELGSHRITPILLIDTFTATKCGPLSIATNMTSQSCLCSYPIHTPTDNKSIWRKFATPKAITIRFTVTREFAVTVSAESGKGLGRDVVIWCCFSLYACLFCNLNRRNSTRLTTHVQPSRPNSLKTKK